jgi:hypothetical protein
VLASTNQTATANPVSSGPYRQRPGEITTSDIIVSFRGGKETGSVFHLGGIKKGASNWLWKTARTLSQGTSYTGNYPSDGSFDIGNSVINPGNVAMVVDRSIFWGYNGEFWKSGQVNKYNHVYDNGLFIGQFGTTRNTVGLAQASAGMAGNAFSPALVKVGSDYYLYHNDESDHNGVHRWKISGLSTIQEQTIPITK